MSPQTLTPPVTDTPVASDETATPPPMWRPPQRTAIFTVALLALGFTGVLLILWAWHLPPFTGSGETTDNAYVRGRTVVIAPQVSGYVSEVLVKDYETVQPGQILARIDDRIYQQRAAAARANLAAAEASLANSVQARASRSAATLGQGAALAAAQAQLLRAQADMKRVDELVSDGSVSVRERDSTVASLRAAEAQVRQAQAASEIGRQDVLTVEVGRGGLLAQVEAARAQLQLAQIDLANTAIRAPEGGQLARIIHRNSVRLSV